MASFFAVEKVSVCGKTTMFFLRKSIVPPGLAVVSGGGSNLILSLLRVAVEDKFWWVDFAFDWRGMARSLEEHWTSGGNHSGGLSLSYLG